MSLNTRLAQLPRITLLEDVTPIQRVLGVGPALGRDPGVALFAKPDDLGLFGGDSGKVLAGLLEDVPSSGYCPAGSHLLFIMTGASPVLFDYGPA